MIRIETTAEFDAEGRFFGRIEQPVSPGRHPVALSIEEGTIEQSALSDTQEGHLKWEGAVLVWTGPVPPGIENAHREILEERERRIVEGQFE